MKKQAVGSSPQVQKVLLFSQDEDLCVADFNQVFLLSATASFKEARKDQTFTVVHSSMGLK